MASESGHCSPLLHLQLLGMKEKRLQWHLMDSSSLHIPWSCKSRKHHPQQLMSRSARCGGGEGRGCLHPIPGLRLSVHARRASHNLHVIKAQGKQILSRDLSSCRERVHGELGRGCNDENKSVCVNNKGRMMMRLISKALPFMRRVSPG